MTGRRETAARAELLRCVEGRAGIALSHALQHRLDDAVAHVMDVTGERTEAEVAARVRRDPDAFEALVGAVVVGETHLFRDRPQLETLRRDVLPALARRGPLRAWSAGCATGEEAYTLAILLGEGRASGSVLGTDLSRDALERAARGVYRPWSFRGVSEDERRRWFVDEEGGHRVRRRVRRRVRFEQHNLLGPPPAGAVFHLVLCRNVLVYLTADAVATVAGRLHDALAPGGWLFTAATDPALDVPGLERVAVAGTLAYRRLPAAQSTEARSSMTAPRAPAAKVRPRPLAASTTSRQPPRRTRSGGHEASPVAPLAARARNLADNGRYDDAFAMVRAGCDARPDDAELRVVRAMLEMHSGQLEAAAQSLTAARFLAPDLVAVHVLLGRVETARGRPTPAARSLRTASRLLASLPADAPVALMGERAGELAAVVREDIGAA